MGPARKPIIAVLTLGVLFVLGIFRAVDLYSRRAEVLTTSSRRADNLASILSEYLRGTFSAGDAALRQLALHSQQVGGAARLMPTGRRASPRRAPGWPASDRSR